MKTKLFAIMALSITLAACTSKNDSNPFFEEKWNTPHETFPFDRIQLSHYMPAFEEGMRLHNAEIEAIANNADAPTFDNTIVAMERSGQMLSRVISAFFNINHSDTNDDIDSLAQQITPLLSEHEDAIMLNQKLFERVKAVYEQRESLNLDTEDAKLLEDTYKGFSRNGANLSDADKETYKELSARLSQLTLTFGQNALKATNAWTKLVTDESQLEGLSDDVKTTLKENAEQAGQEGWLLNLKPTTLFPVLKFASNRELRHEIWLAANTEAIGGEFDNRGVIRDIVNTRLEIAKLLGYNTYADYALENRMAKNADNVYNLLNQLRDAYMPVAQQEYAELQAYADSLGLNDKLQAWDWSYYSERLKNERYAFNDDELRPYFELENVKKGVFGLATKLYGLTFVKNPDIQVYNPEVEAFDVLDPQGQYLGVLYTDFHPRAGKRGGAWMNEFKAQWHEADGTDSRPHITLVMNFTRPTKDKPALLTFDEVNTFCHEFGHALHGLLTKCKYASLSGTNVYRDFVEMPSQFNENFMNQKEFLDGFAVHYLTGEKIPQELLDKLQKAKNYHAAYACVRQLSFGFLDMAFHSSNQPFNADPVEFEHQAMAQVQLFPVVPNTGMAEAFTHIFSGGYAAGYYSYKWAEVIDADAFSKFEENGIFDKPTADSFRTNILERGGTEDPMTLYVRFRGKQPTIDALMRRDGIK